jgi:hypothetical protein
MSASMCRLVVLLVAGFVVGCNSSKKVDLGDGCSLNSDCNSPLVCAFGKCHTACEETRDCAPGQSCVNTAQGGVCQSATDAQCDGSTGCAGGLVCAVDNRCRAACNADGNCRPGQKCAAGVCADSGELDPTGQLPPNPTPGSDGGTDARGADAGGNSACQPGPGGFCWQTCTDSTWSNPGPSASWVVPPSPDLVHVAARSGVDTLAGMLAQIRGGNRDIDLGRYDQLWFDADVPQGQSFTVGAATDASGNPSCYWYLVGTGRNRYTVDLRAANGCVPSACGYDRSTSRTLSFITKNWGTSNAIDIALTDLGFSAVTSGFGPTTIGGSAGIGPGGWCSSLFSWGSDTAAVAWVGAPTTSQARVKVTDASTAGTAGLMIELPAGKQDLSGGAYVDIDANVALSQTGQFEVVLTSSNFGACHYHVPAAVGATTYSLPLASPTECYTGQGHVFTPSSVVNVTVGTLWDFTGTADITVTRIAAR